MMQYKIMELGLNKELASIHNTQKQIAKMQGKGSDDEEEEEEEEEAEGEPEAEANASDKQEEGEKSDDKQEWRFIILKLILCSHNYTFL